MASILTQLFKYGIGGGAAFLLTLASTYLLTEKLGTYYLIASIIGYLLGLVLNFIFQAWVTFATKNSSVVGRFLYFLLFQLAGLLIFVIFMFILTEKLLLFYLASLIIASTLVFLFNFSMSKIFVFYQKI